MLTSIEKIILTIWILGTFVAALFSVRRLIRIISIGQGKPDWDLARKRFALVFWQTSTFKPVFRFRFLSSLFHAFLGWGFGFYILVNIFDLIHAYFAGFWIPGMPGNIYRLVTDICSFVVLVGMAFFLIRRFVVRCAVLSTDKSTFLDAKARAGIARDSAIVAGFIILHVGARLVGESFLIAHDKIVPFPDITNNWQLFASALANVWIKMSPHALVIGQHIAFWLSFGLLLAFIPYFPYSKHIHLFFAPLNYLLKPARRSLGELIPIKAIVDQSGVEKLDINELKQPAKLRDLGWEQIMDAYACIMCFRCQEVCPPYSTGGVLSPAALEINKRYFINCVNASVPGEKQETKLVDFAITPEAIWECTTCGACVNICPVGNEPMRDILDIRRKLRFNNNPTDEAKKIREKVLRTKQDQNKTPWATNFERTDWAKGLSVLTVKENHDPEILWWVGCAAATEPTAMKTAQAFAKILNSAGVNYAVLGEEERCTGDLARRAGFEDIFFKLAQINIANINTIKPKRIITTCPHCLHTLKYEYPELGKKWGKNFDVINYDVVHHTQFILELIFKNKLGFKEGNLREKVTFHDPCYLGRYNQIYEEPRELLERTGLDLVEMSRHKDKSYCCGGGGSQWIIETHGNKRINEERLNEAKATGAALLAVGCPFCLMMLEGAVNHNEDKITVKDIAEIVVERMK
jgi:Fe-S oxidoreductase